MSHGHPEFVAVHKETNDDIMHLKRLGKADRLAGQALDPGTSRQGFAFYLLRIALAGYVLIHIDMARVRTPIVGVILWIIPTLCGVMTFTTIEPLSKPPSNRF
jgi:hypothetical protein